MATVERFDQTLHDERSVSREGVCGQGGGDTCHNPAVYSVIGENYKVAACDDHLRGAVRQALGLPALT